MNRLLMLALIFFLNFPAYGEDTVVKDLGFSSHGVRLSGSLVMPAEGPIHAAVVFVHGSGPQKRSMHWAQRFASEGIAALVYDKRGVGRSGGTYEGNQSVSEQNITLLADDALAAFEKLRVHSKTKDVALGLAGISQAGWIVPLAAQKSARQSEGADFMVLWSGPVCKVSEEDIFSKYTADLDARRVPGYREALAARTTPYIWPDFLGKDSDPSDNLAALDIPGLWVFGAQDGSVPVDLSIERLAALMAKGHDYEYALFSNLGHNNMSETFSMVTDWIRGLPE